MSCAVSLQVRRQDLGNRNFDVFVVLGLLGVEAQPVGVVDANEMAADLDCREALEPYRPCCEESDDEPVSVDSSLISL